MELVLLAAAVVFVIFLVWSLGRRSSQRMVDDTCALDHRKPSQGRDRQVDSLVEPPPSPDDLVHPEIRDLVRGLHSDMPVAVATAARALGESGHADAVGPLIRALGRDHRTVQFAVVEALLALGPLAAIPVREGRDRERDPALSDLLGVIHEQLERKASGQPTLPTTDILKMSPKLIDEISRELGR
jgi:HEAT repeats